MAENIQQITEKGQNQNAQEINNIENHYHTPASYVQKAMPHDLAKIIHYLIPLVRDDSLPSWSDTDYEVGDKILSNSVIKYAPIIQEYAGYGIVINTVYTTLEQENPGSKGVFLRGIRKRYHLYRGELQTKNPNAPLSEIIQKNADNIIDHLHQELLQKYTTSSNRLESVSYERVDECITMIVVAAFIDCKILENPSFYSV